MRMNDYCLAGNKQSGYRIQYFQRGEALMVKQQAFNLQNWDRYPAP
jgi:hypothetical protein